MQKFKNLHIPRKNSRSPIPTKSMRSISDIQENRFCNRADVTDCNNIICESCLFNWLYTEDFKEWYRDKRTMYIKLRRAASN